MGLENKIPRHSQYYIYLWQVFLDSIPIFLTVFLFLVGKTFIFSDDFPMIQDPKPAVYSLPPRLSTSIGKHDEDRSHVVTWPPNAQQMILDVSKWLIPSAWKSATEGGVYCSVILRVVCFHRFSKGPKTGQVAKLGLNRAQQRPNIELSLRCGRFLSLCATRLDGGSRLRGPLFEPSRVRDMRPASPGPMEFSMEEESLWL